MSWFIPRILAAALLAALGAIAGTTIGWGGDAVLLLTVLGASVGASLSAFADRMKGYRLMQWLRGERERPAPRATAFWGELGYRIERQMMQLQREVESERANTRAFLAAIEASPNGVLLLDGEDQIAWCNAVAADHFGLDPTRDLRQRVTNLVRDPAFVSQLQHGPFDGSVVFEGRQPGGSLQVMVRPYGDAGKKLVLSQDITARERADAMRRDFVANVSHEIRTPLTVLAGFVETMDSLPLSEVERQRVLGLMGQQTARMQALVADLLTLAQLEGSPRPPPDEWHGLDEILRPAQVEAVALSAGRHTLQVDETPHVELAGRVMEIRSAIGNLLSNAVRYTPGGGQVRLTWLLREDGSGVLSVIDTGPGIAREHLPRLTERFYRVESGRSRDTGGTGLGLSIVKHVMQRHGGEIDISSETGRGSVFRLIFPPFRVRLRPGLPDAGAEGSRRREAPVDRHQLAGLGIAPLRGDEAPAGDRQ